MLVPMRIGGKEEISISRAITRCKYKNIFLENSKSVIKMRIRVQKCWTRRALDPRPDASNVGSRKEFELKLNLVSGSKLDSHVVVELRYGNSI